MRSDSKKPVAWGKPCGCLDPFIELWRKPVCWTPEETFNLIYVTQFIARMTLPCQGVKFRICVLCRGRIIWHHDHTWCVAAPAHTFLQDFAYKNEGCFVFWDDCTKCHKSQWSKSSPLHCYVFLFLRKSTSHTVSFLRGKEKVSFFEARYCWISKICEKQIHPFLHNQSNLVNSQKV